jgi:LmbE family N-acetylglucosaminyl deacetylase
MIRCKFEVGDGPLRVLCLGSHSDDIEIGCGGTVLHLGMEHPDCEFHWVVFNATGVRETEARKAASLFSKPSQLKSITTNGFPDGFMPYVAADIKQVFERLKSEIDPDLIFTHYRNDAHQDHRVISQLTWNTFRNHQILEFEIPKYDGDFGNPSFFVPLPKELIEKKISNIVNTFDSQREKRWFEGETFRSVMRLRGMECNSPTGYAEAFYCRKILF